MPITSMIAVRSRTGIDLETYFFYIFDRPNPLYSRSQERHELGNLLILDFDRLIPHPRESRSLSTYTASLFILDG